ncbi:MAG: MgtC/SapB family protein [Eubacteriales bacterium]|jgi:putative Mg2+ transporter-C (MgtC) family protein|nr:MgtC/SapB family protein [Eubacteriales bacterium]
MVFDYSLLIRLVVAALLGGIIGFERGGSNHEAGLRTHIILCLGASMIAVLSELMVKQYGINSEVMRMSAQVISGVGFLGAGSIIMDGNRIRGITTAAGLWTTAGVGLAVGSGNYILGIATVVLMLFATLGLKSITTKLKLSYYRIKVKISDRGALKDLLKKLSDNAVKIDSIKVEEGKELDTVYAVLEIKVSRHHDMDSLIYQIGGYNEVVEVTAI